MVNFLFTAGYSILFWLWHIFCLL